MLSKPKSPPSLGSSSATSISTPNRSRTVLAYSARFNRCTDSAPACGHAAAAASSVASSAATNDSRASELRLRLLARRHHAEPELPEPASQMRASATTSRAFAAEANPARELGIVVAIDAVAVDHRPALVQHGIGRALRDGRRARRRLPRQQRRRRRGRSTRLIAARPTSCATAGPAAASRSSATISSGLATGMKSCGPNGLRFSGSSGLSFSAACRGVSPSAFFAVSEAPAAVNARSVSKIPRFDGEMQDGRLGRRDGVRVRAGLEQ